MQPLERLLSPIMNDLKNIGTQNITENIKKIEKQKMDVLQNRITASQVNLVRPEVVESWKRSFEKGLDPLIYKQPPILDVHSFEKRLTEKKSFIQMANPYIFQLEAMLAHVEAYIILSDEQGIILRVVQALGKNKFRLVPGTIWAEDTIGTCAHGMSIILRSPIQLCGSEHFSQIFNHISGSAAPIFDANGNLEGTLTIVSPHLYSQNSYSLGLVVIMADAIQKGFQLSVNKASLNIMFTTTTDAVIVINKSGVITETNIVAHGLFKSLNKDLLGLPIDDVLGKQFFEKSILPAVKLETNTNIKIDKSKNHLYSCLVQPIGNSNNAGYIITLRHINQISKGGRSTGDFSTRFTFDNIVGTSSQSMKLKALAKKFARFNSNILIQGKSGTGKEVYAQAIHHESRPTGPFIAVNCAAIPETLIESELFGYETGAFTGAARLGKPGKIELANGGTLFLDEIGDMPLELQAVLLRVLEDKMIMHVGGSHYIPVDFRLITATNKNLLNLVEKNAFREDLYYRLAVFKIDVPPLKGRGSDIIQLIEHFMNIYAEIEHVEKPTLSNPAKYILLQYNWPGNVRQLQNTISYAVCMSAEEGMIYPEHLPEEILNTYTVPDLDSDQDQVELLEDKEQIELLSDNKVLMDKLSIKDMEVTAIKKALQNSNYHIRDAAKILGISKSTLYRKIKIYELWRTY